MKENPTIRLEIDELRLGDECVEQATMYFQASKRLAEAKLEEDQAKMDLDATFAELSREVRAKPAAFGLGEKVTEAAVQAAITEDRDYKSAHTVWLQARYKANLAQGRVTAMEHRKRALTLLVELRRQEWYADPKVSREGREAIKAEEKKRVRQLGQRALEDEDSRG